SPSSVAPLKNHSEALARSAMTRNTGTSSVRPTPPPAEPDVEKLYRGTWPVTPFVPTKSYPVESTERCACPANPLIDGMASKRPHVSGRPAERNPPCTVLKSRATRKYPASIDQREWRSDASADMLPNVFRSRGSALACNHSPPSTTPWLNVALAGVV